MQPGQPAGVSGHLQPSAKVVIPKAVVKPLCAAPHSMHEDLGLENGKRPGMLDQPQALHNL
jgi:hypothetical protein